MLPPAESPATAIRLGSSSLAAPSRTIHSAVAYPCSIATGYRASSERSYSTNATAAALAPTANSRTSRSCVAALPITQPPPCMKRITGNVPTASGGRTIRTRTSPSVGGHGDPGDHSPAACRSARPAVPRARRGPAPGSVRTGTAAWRSRDQRPRGRLELNGVVRAGCCGQVRLFSSCGGWLIRALSVHQ